MYPIVVVVASDIERLDRVLQQGWVLGRPQEHKNVFLNVTDDAVLGLRNSDVPMSERAARPVLLHLSKATPTTPKQRALLIRPQSDGKFDTSIEHLDIVTNLAFGGRWRLHFAMYPNTAWGYGIFKEVV